MKKINLIFILFLVLIAFSCNNKDLQEIASIQNLNSRSDTMSIYNYAGRKHNLGLTSNFKCSETNWTPETIVSCTESSIIKLGIDYSYIENINLNDTLVIWLNKLYIANNTNDIKDFLIFSVEYFNEQLNFIGLSGNINIIDTFAIMIENNNYDFDVIYNLYNNNYYSPLIQESVEGFVAILEYSSIYWQNDNNPDTVTSAFVQLDAAGYLIGWVYAVVSDYQDDGDVLAEDQWKRIGAGVAAGVGTSTGAKKWWSW